jgi:methionine synthase II (cobalamin-independent)
VAEKQAFPWGPGTATGIGSMPGDNPPEAARTVAGELPDLPHLAELPARGPGADITGRAAALLVEIPVEVTPRGWRIAERPGRDLRRARSLLSSDLDAMEEALDGYQGPLKVQLAGPWTLAATIEQPHSLKVALADPGLVADLAASLAEGAAAHVAEVAKRVPKARLILQLDEPALPAVADGAVPTPSGLSRVRAVDEEILRDRLRTVLAATPAYTVVHSCAPGYPFGVVTGAGADALSFDLSLLKPSDFDELAVAAEAGRGLFAGAVRVLPAAAAGHNDPQHDARNRQERTRPPTAAERATDTARSIAELWRKMSQPPASCAPQVVVTPACGLAGVSPERALAVLRRVRQTAAILPEMMGELG